MNNGGVESFVLSYYKELHDLCEFDFLCFDDSKYIPYELIESLGGKVFVVPHLKHLHKFNKAVDKILKENQFEIIHSNLNTLSVFPLRIAKKNKCKVRIAHSHSASNKKELKRHIAKTVLKTFSKTYSNVYLACSEVAGRFQFGNKTFDKGQVKILNNAIDVNKFKFNSTYKEEIRKEYNLAKDDYVVGTVGRFVGTKNHQLVLELAKENKETKFFIVGNGPLEEEMRKTVKENGLNNVIIAVPDQEIEKYYSAFDMFVLPSLYEGLGLTAIEAQSNGLYTICSKFVPNVTLLTGYGEFLPIEKEDLSKWNEVINKRYPRKDLSNKIKEAGYDIKTSAIDLYNLYVSLLNK